jgi:hypothetical protein
VAESETIIKTPLAYFALSWHSTTNEISCVIKLKYGSFVYFDTTFHELNAYKSTHLIVAFSSPPQLIHHQTHPNPNNH